MGSQRLVVDRQTNLFPGYPCVLFVETVQGPLFLSTNQNYYCTCLQNLKGAIHSTQISGNSGAGSNGTVIFEKFVSIIFGQSLEVVLLLFRWSYHFVRCSAPVSSVVVKTTTTSTKTGFKNYTCVIF